MSAGFRILPLGNQDRTTFRSGVPVLDRYFREQVTQDIRRRVSNCFVALDPMDMVAGYYTFAATSVPMVELPAGETKRLPRYPLLPAALIGRLAVDQRFQRRRLGGTLIADAAMRAMRSDPAIFALIVDAKDESTVAFYRHHGFQPLASRPLSLFLTIATAAKTLPNS